jgi:D-3-phosphoglycerate dehydrogenase / 2-oxoglutarate reductase
MQQRVLVADPIAQEGIDILARALQVDVHTGLTPDELEQVIGDYAALIVRSESRVTAKVLAAGKLLKVVARAGVGVDNVDVEAATRMGIVVVNAPTGNTVAAAEHTIALIMALARHIPQASASLQGGEWKRSRFTGVELKGKVLGVIGLGKVGAEVAKRAQGLEMEVVATDPYLSPERAAALNVRAVDLETLLRAADFITVHVPLSAATGGLLGERELSIVKPGVRIVNVARGGVVDEDALASAIHSGRVAGAAVDVFRQEPVAPGCPLLHNDRIIVTPHLGASTIEAQHNVAVDVAEQVVDVLSGRPAKYAVNAPTLLPEAEAELAPYLVVADRMGRYFTQVEGGPIDLVEIAYSGHIAEHNSAALRAAMLRGLLESICDRPVNLINAGIIAADRGIRVQERGELPDETFGNLITLRIGERSLSGAFLHGEPHIVRINSVSVDLEPKGFLLVARCCDRPGLLGRIGTVLGQAAVNINSALFSPPGADGWSVTILNVGAAVPAEVQAQVAAIDGVDRVRLAQF